MEMLKYYTVRWDSYGCHGAHSSGHTGKYGTLAEAETAASAERQSFETDRRIQPLADTDFRAVGIVVDDAGNSVEVVS